MVTLLPAHTPYDGSAKPFTIGLKPLDPARWLEIDAYRDAYIAEKRRLYAEMPEKVFVAEEGTQEAQQEVLELIVEHLREHFPEFATNAPPSPLSASLRSAPLPRIAGERMGASLAAAHPLPSRSGGEVSRRSRDGEGGLGETNAAEVLGARLAPPLHTASLLVQEDLVLMRRNEDGWRLVAASLCFPSAWSLAEKFGRPLQDIHKPVPGFGRGTRSAELIERMFDKLQVTQPVERMNWSLQAGPALYMPLSNVARIERAVEKPSRFPEADVAANAFIRVERQTLRRLPKSGDILFTIRIYLDPMKVLEAHPDRAVLAASFAAQLAAMEDAQIDYKGLSADRERLVARLRTIAR